MTALTDSLAEGAVQAVLEAGELLTDPAAVQSIRSKGETDYVTNVDVAVQAFLRERLAALAPDVPSLWERSRTIRGWTGAAPAGFWTRWTAPPI